MVSRDGCCAGMLLLSVVRKTFERERGKLWCLKERTPTEKAEPLTDQIGQDSDYCYSCVVSKY